MVGLGYGLLFAVFYGTGRFLLEYLRDDAERGSVGILSTSQLIGAMTVVASVVLLGYLWKRWKADPELYGVPADGTLLFPDPEDSGASASDTDFAPASASRKKGKKKRKKKGRR